MRKKFLTLLLAACFLFSLLPVTAFAEQTKWTQTDSVSTSKDYASLMNGEYYEAKTPSGEKTPSMSREKPNKVSRLCALHFITLRKNPTI